MWFYMQQNKAFTLETEVRKMYFLIPIVHPAFLLFRIWFLYYMNLSILLSVLSWFMITFIIQFSVRLWCFPDQNLLVLMLACKEAKYDLFFEDENKWTLVLFLAAHFCTWIFLPSMTESSFFFCWRWLGWCWHAAKSTWTERGRPRQRPLCIP